MRKSKANPAKYAKGYRKISQRRMTNNNYYFGDDQAGDDDVNGDEQVEIQKLREMLRSSYEHLSNQPGFESGLDDRLKLSSNSDGKKKAKKKKKDDGTTASSADGKDQDQEVNTNEKNDKNSNTDEVQNNELIDDTFECGDCNNNNNNKLSYKTDETEMILLPSSSKKRKHTKQKQPVVILTPEEIKAAKNKHKALERKLNQIETRREKKKRRTELYEKLSMHAVSDVEMKLLERSSELGKKLSKKEMLRKALQKERAGIELNEDERDLLYVERDEVADEEVDQSMQQINHDSSNDNDVQVEPLAFPSSGRKKKKSKAKKRSAAINDDGTDANDEDDKDNEEENERLDDKTGTTSQQNKINDSKSTEKEIKQDIKRSSENKPQSFAEMMMAGLSSLKTKAMKDKEEEDKRRAIEEDKRLELERIKEEEERKNRPKYVPRNPLIIKSAAAMGMAPQVFKKGDQSWRIMPVNRPEEIKSKRYDLPVSSMEFEIIDSIRNHSVTILCSETGSGKSTQVPQFLYESGVTLGNATSAKDDDRLYICVTQPRRVAAVSTAKRVCYEMGHSKDKGQSIQGTGKKGEGNLVAYQTKYESAGVGSETRIKFMTDGILLQEIKSDLLLRKYAVIVLDEAHERNLNTDVLLGLLSAALPLRRKAALEGSLPPLKVVIMSATLRVEDFTSNGKLFVEDKPNIVKVPGRTFPVTIHHSKTTELDDYEGAAFQKVCKIHKKLPPGGILVFLTGKQEIIRMVNRLRRRLKSKTQHLGSIKESIDVEVNELDESGNIPRDMDDDEADGDLFQKGSHSEDEDDFEDIDDMGAEVTKASDKEDNIPKNVKILPLYSLLSVKEQAKVFEPVDEDTRLIVVATNIAETSLTIPGISYVVDTGRQKCRNYHAGTGVASYDVMWISKAAADQRAGRAGRTGPGHCYRIFSSSVYARHLDGFALPEVLTRPLEDVVLAMKAMGISNVGNFPFPTSPDPSQLNAAVKLLANIGCVDISDVEVDGGDGKITLLGSAISKLPIGVRYGKMLLVAAQANVLDYGIVMVSVLSEASPFRHISIEQEKDAGDETDEDSVDALDEVDRNNAQKQEEKKQKEARRHRWCHNGGDVLAGVLAAGAYSFAGKGAGGLTENLAYKRFCEDNSLSPVIMQRIQKMRQHLARLAHQRLSNAEGTAAKTGKILPSMSPPSILQEQLLRQAITSGLLDNVARRATQGRLGSNGASIPRTAYLSCRSALNEPLFIDKKSVIFSRDPRQLPEWICYDSIIRKTTKNGETISTMTNVTPIDPQWLGALADGSNLLTLGEPIDFPTPKYCKDRDEVMCSVITKYGAQGWLLPPIQIPMNKALRLNSKQSSAMIGDDPYRWFIRSLFEGKVFDNLQGLKHMLNDDPSIITRKKPVGKVALLVSSLSENGIDSASKLVKYWEKNDSKFLFKYLKSWVKKDCVADVKKMWIETVKQQIKEYD